MKKCLAAALLILLLLSGCVWQPAPPTSPDAGTEALTVHFLDVGQADCALVEWGGRYLLIDGGNAGDGSFVVSYLQKQGVQTLEAVVCSHAHEDHVGGLAAVLAVFPTKAVYAPTCTYASQYFDDFLYYAHQQGLSVTVPAPGDTIPLGGAAATVLGPVEQYAEPNNTSLVLSVRFGENRFLFTGDMEQKAEIDLLDSGADVKADVLKVGHHGSSTSTGYRLLYEVSPDFAVISCEKNNDYGHPHAEPLSRLRDAGVQLYRTDLMGTVVARSDGKTVTFSAENAGQEPSVSQTYIGNRKSGVVHLPSCASLPAEHNRVLFESYADALRAGYTPCANCMG